MEGRSNLIFETGSFRVPDVWSGKGSGLLQILEQEAGWTDLLSCDILENILAKKELI